MMIHLIRYTPAPDELAQQAAAICTAKEPTERGMRTAVDSGHESILEHASYTFLVQGVSRVTLAQLTRHRLASFSVQSQRYVNMGEMPVVVPPAIMADGELMDEWADITDRIRAFYHKATSHGVAQEDARYLCPEACATRLLMTMNGRELRHFLALRECGKAQWEIRQMARLCHEAVKYVAPITFENAGPGCVRGMCPEKRPCGNPYAGG